MIGHGGLAAWTEIAARSAFTLSGDLAAHDQLRDQALRRAPGDAWVPGEEFSQGQPAAG